MKRTDAERQRYSDDTAPFVVPVTAELALRVCGVTEGMPRAEALGRIRDRRDEEDGGLSDDELQALIDAGWTELDD